MSGSMDGFEPPSKIDLQYANERVVFAISNCCTDKKYSFFSLNREQAEVLVRRLQHFEQLEWRQLAGLPRENGLTPERVNGESWGLIHEQNSSPTKLAEQFYFHIRIEPRGKFRIFGYQRRQMFYITHIDPDGKIHDH